MATKKQEPENKDRRDQQEPSFKLSAFGKRLILFLLLIILIWPFGYGLLWGWNKCYSIIDQTTFTKLDQNIQRILENTTPESDPKQKGVALCKAMINRLQKEMNSSFGWTVNDLIISPTSWFDNRDNRQKGVIYATRMLVNYFATNFAKYGAAGKEHPALKDAREQYFAFTSDSWWFPSTEDQYNKGINLIQLYAHDLEQDRAIFNVRTDNLYELFDYIVGAEFLDQPLGLLIEEDRKVKYTDLDDRVYYTQGTILVLRDFLTVLTHLYPQIEERGGEENIRIALMEMDHVCTFDPLIVLRGHHDSLFADHRGKMAKYLINIRERLNDVGQSLSR